MFLRGFETQQVVHGLLHTQASVTTHTHFNSSGVAESHTHTALRCHCAILMAQWNFEHSEWYLTSSCLWLLYSLSFHFFFCSGNMQTLWQVTFIPGTSSSLRPSRCHHQRRSFLPWSEIKYHLKNYWSEVRCYRVHLRTCWSGISGILVSCSIFMVIWFEIVSKLNRKKGWKSLG